MVPQAWPSMLPRAACCPSAEPLRFLGLDAELAERGCAELLPVLGLCAAVDTRGGQGEPGQWESPRVVAGARGSCWPRPVVSRRKLAST